MPPTYTALLPINARGHREPGPGDHRAPTQLDLRWLWPAPAPLWSTAGRRTTTAATLPPAARWAVRRDRWRLFDAELDQEIRLAELTDGDDAGTAVTQRIALNHAPPGDSPAGSEALTAV